MIPRGPFRATLPLVLASSSPRRQAMLASLGLHFQVRAPQVDESVPAGADPAHHARALAEAKALACAAPGAVVLGADTVVALEDEILGKPRDADEAFLMLRRLAGAEHWVHTGVAVHHAGHTQSFVISAAVQMRRFADAVLRAYAASGEGLDKAGAYAVQGLGAFLVQSVRGSVSAVVGLPLAETVALLLDMNAIEAAS